METRLINFNNAQLTKLALCQA